MIVALATIGTVSLVFWLSVFAMGISGLFNEPWCEDGGKWSRR